MNRVNLFLPLICQTIQLQIAAYKIAPRFFSIPLNSDVVMNKAKQLAENNHEKNVPMVSGSSKNYMNKKKITSGGTTANQNDITSGIRLNKCFPTLSRREADEAIRNGRVTLNNNPVSFGIKVKFGDIIKLDGKKQNWESAAAVASLKSQNPLQHKTESRNNVLVYLKYWKPVGITCTTDLDDKTNIIKAGGFDLFPQRLFPIGRLDKDSSGLILMTSDGKIVNQLLDSKERKEKKYLVTLDKVPLDEHIQQLATGVVITTTAQRDRKTEELSALTLPCKITRVKGNPRSFEITLIEGRNRQIRKMMEVFKYTVVQLHRITFSGITLSGLSEGAWAELTEHEMKIIFNDKHKGVQ